MLGDILILVLLLLVNGFFAMAEMAVVSARRIRLVQQAAAGSTGARAALRLLDDPTRFLSTVQIGITLVGVLAGVYSGAKFAEPLQAALQTWPLIARHAEVVAFGVVVLIVTYLSLVAGELVPKRWALVRRRHTANRSCRDLPVDPPRHMITYGHQVADPVNGYPLRRHSGRPRRRGPLSNSGL